jgi:hypothetical protein
LTRRGLGHRAVNRPAADAFLPPDPRRHPGNARDLYPVCNMEKLCGRSQNSGKIQKDHPKSLASNDLKKGKPPRGSDQRTSK